MDPNNPMSVKSALRYWDGTIQYSVCYFLFFESGNWVKQNPNRNFVLLPFASALYPFSSIGSDWDKILLDHVNSSAW